MDSRRFGIEIEHYFPPAPQPQCPRRNCYCNDDYYDEGEGVADCADFLRENKLAHWTDNIHCDGSGVEINSPPLQGQKGFNELKKVMNLLKGAGAYVTEADGMHIHHEAPEFRANKELCRKLLHSWEDNYDAIKTWVADYRHGYYGACARFTKADADHYLDGRGYYGAGFHPHRVGWAVNVGALREHGTIEIRMHHGTLDYDEAEAWIKFGQAFISSVVRGVDIKCDSTKKLLNVVKATPKAKRILALKEAQRERWQPRGDRW